MEVTNQESILLQRFVEKMDQVSETTDQEDGGDDALLLVYKDFIGNKDYADFKETLTNLATYYVSNVSLLILVIPDKSISDQMVQTFFFNTIDEVDEEKRKKIILQLSIHRYMLFEAIANKASILEQVSGYIDELIIEPGNG